MKNNNPHSGSLFDDFLKEEGIYEEASSIAVKQVLARQLLHAMNDQNISKVKIIRRGVKQK